MKRVLVVGSLPEATEITECLSKQGYEAGSVRDFTERGTDFQPKVALLCAEISNDSPVQLTLDDLLETVRSAWHESAGTPLHAHASLPAALIGKSEPAVRLASTVGQLASKPRSAVLLHGETGTGKRHVAKALHDSTYPDGDFVVLEAGNAQARIAKILETNSARRELLAGAGTTLYVHEIGETALDVQTNILRLLRDLSESARSVRLIASSSRDLGRAARDGFVRPELAHRFPFVLEIPPLRERVADIPLLVNHFADNVASRYGAPPLRFSEAALKRLEEHDWPGNVRELCHLVERCTLTRGHGDVEVDDLPPFQKAKTGIDFRLPVTGIDLAELERDVLVQALRLAENNQTRAAALLGLTRDQIRYRMSKFGIAMRESSSPPTPMLPRPTIRATSSRDPQGR
jgi:two-component system response regulator AtoC